MSATVAQRRAPEGGYDFEAKSAFRRFVWDAIASRGMGGLRHEHVLLMPSLEGIEIDEALSRGFLQSGLHVVDSNPAIVATLRRRYPDIRTYGVGIDRAHDRVAEAGIRLFGASIDFCSNAVWSTAKILVNCSESDCWQDGARVVVNVLRGREDKLSRSLHITDEGIRSAAWLGHVLARWDSGSVKPNIRDAWRLWTLCAALPRHIAVVRRVSGYVSSNGQSFMTAVLSMRRVAAVRQALFEKRAGGVGRAAMDAFISTVAMDNVVRIAEHVGLLSDDDGRDLPQWAVDSAKRRDIGAGVGFHASLFTGALRKFERDGGVVFSEHLG